MLKRFALLFASLVFLAIRPLIRAFRRKRQTGFTNVLCYHGIPDHLAAAFASQMQFLKSNCLLIGPNQLFIADHEKMRTLVTFDDALISLRRNAFPILAKLDIPCVVFVPTELLGSKCTWMRSAEQFLACEGRPIPQRDLEQIQTERVMNLQELRALDHRRVFLASHGTRHRKLATLSTGELEEELQESKRALEEITGGIVDLISFPHGNYNTEVLQRMSHAGYRAGFSIDPFTAPCADQVFGRIVLEPSDWHWEFKLKVAGAYEWMAYYKYWMSKVF